MTRTIESHPLGTIESHPLGYDSDSANLDRFKPYVAQYDSLQKELKDVERRISVFESNDKSNAFDKDSARNTLFSLNGEDRCPDINKDMPLPDAQILEAHKRIKSKLNHNPLYFDISSYDPSIDDKWAWLKYGLISVQEMWISHRGSYRIYDNYIKSHIICFRNEKIDTLSEIAHNAWWISKFLKQSPDAKERKMASSLPYFYKSLFKFVVSK